MANKPKKKHGKYKKPVDNHGVGMSKKNKKWKDKGVKRYNQRVWPGWRESDGKASPVTTYKKGDLLK